MPPKKVKRKATSPLNLSISPTQIPNSNPHLSQATSPSIPPVLDINMEAYMKNVNDKLEEICGSLKKMDAIESALNSLVKENTALREDVSAIKKDNEKKDEAIMQLTEHCNRLDQAARGTTLRIIGLPVTTATSHAELIKVVYREILQPVLVAAKENGEIPESAQAIPHYLVDNVFCIPSKSGSPTPVILKLSSQYMRSMIFRYKKAALPIIKDAANRDRSKYAVFEDLSPANHAILRSFADDKKRVKSVWSFGGQIRFKTHDSDTVYKIKSITDTYESLVKPSRSTPASRLHSPMAS
jgi:hypothetical protein